MNVAYRSEGDVQTAGSDRGQAGIVDVTDTRAAPSKATTAFVQAMAFVSFIDRDNQLLRVFHCRPLSGVLAWITWRRVPQLRAGATPCLVSTGD